jgi:TB2/DP1, HVA22 family
MLTEQFKKVEDATGYPAAWFLVAATFLFLGLLTWVGGSKLLVDLLGFVYPAYMSFKSMDTNSGDDTQWLTYWICFSALSIVETMLSFVTALIPMYFWIKIGIIVVCVVECFVYTFAFFLCIRSFTHTFIIIAVDVVPIHPRCPDHLRSIAATLAVTLFGRRRSGQEEGVNQLVPLVNSLET